MFEWHKRHSSTETWEAYKKQRNKVTSLKPKGFEEFRIHAPTASKNLGEFCRNMKPLIPRSRSNTHTSITLVESSCVISNTSGLAETFKNHFSNMVAVDPLNQQDFPTHPGV